MMLGYSHAWSDQWRVEITDRRHTVIARTVQVSWDLSSHLAELTRWDLGGPTDDSPRIEGITIECITGPQAPLAVNPPAQAEQVSPQPLAWEGGQDPEEQHHELTEPCEVVISPPTGPWRRYRSGTSTGEKLRHESSQLLHCQTRSRHPATRD